MRRHVRTLAMALMLAAVALSTSIYDFTLKTANGEDYPLSNYDHTPVILVVNVASECGFTDVNYRALQIMSSLFILLGTHSCTKVDVNGPNAHPLYTWLKSNVDDGRDVAWNFEKFFVVDGQPWKRIAHNVNLNSLEDEILYALAHETSYHDDDHDEL
ncbi:hypothetical protein DYB38_013251 [Aphanomyces astaci]|uniref:Glutathione peroxidase n=1 Tax=Aphanomyces astaci TaxID=112090 RepID=A0A397E1X9_APHAT|nr:hypothetical protein DYB34_013255 [Aphanomyces astaci]RHY74136.1 hypothetical protein DYB38_013251 [Aphanomyces astaci]